MVAHLFLRRVEPEHPFELVSLRVCNDGTEAGGAGGGGTKVRGAGEYGTVEACEAVGDGAADPCSDLTCAPCAARREV